MPTFVRQFEPHVTRSGEMAKFRFTIRCSSCARSETYEANKPVSDDLVKGYFRDHGWLLGRERTYDLCRTCLAKPQDTTPTRRPTDNGRSGSARSSERRTESISKREQETADILARHLGKPEALAAEVFRPKKQQADPPAPSAVQTPTEPVTGVPLELSQALVSLASDLKGLKGAMEDISGHLNRLVTIGAQQTEAITNLGNLLYQSALQMSEGMQKFAGAIQPAQNLSLPFAEHVRAEMSPRTESVLKQPTADIEPPSAKFPSRKEPKRRQRSKINEKPSGDTAAAIVVKSIPDVNHANRFYTSIRLPRDVWDAAGFIPDDRLLLDWDGQSLTVSRATEGGVKPKAVGKAQVVLQSWKLGNLNLDQLYLNHHNTGFRLTPST